MERDADKEPHPGPRSEQPAAGDQGEDQGDGAPVGAPGPGPADRGDAEPAGARGPLVDAGGGSGGEAETRSGEGDEAGGFDAFQRLDPRWAAAARIGGVLALLPPAALVTGALALGLHRVLRVGTVPAVIGVAGLFALALGWRLVAPGLAWRRWRYRTDERVVVVEHGVIVFRSVLVPLSRIQHVDVQRGPVERVFGLATVVVTTAGTGSDAVVIPGLRPEVATALRDHLMRRSGLLDESAGGGFDDAI